MGSGRATDEAAEFEAWYTVEYPRVLTMLTVVVGSREMAVEATNEAFVRAWERWGRVSRMRSPGGWLYQVAVNVARRQARRRLMERELLRKASVSVEMGTPPAGLQPEVWDAVRSLPQRQRTAVALRYVFDYTEAQIAEIMRIRPGTVAATLSAARRQLAELLSLEQPGATQGPIRTVENPVRRRQGAEQL